jgi:hypothetical protein
LARRAEPESIPARERGSVGGPLDRRGWKPGHQGRIIRGGPGPRDGTDQAEAAYFTAIDGKRTGLIFFDLEDVSQIPVIAEPFFMTVGAAIDFLPVMTAEDVQKGLEEAAKAF